ncbi:MAG: hypothetical protein IPF94_01615 [Betaproteobacteria bacterium]|nr:hypothetical protein [Betaproteobacteria bacterium]
MLAGLLLIAALAHRRRTVLDGAQWRALVGLMVCFYVWTWVSGNGRYFFWGLLLVGPLVEVMARRLPATQAMRNTVIVGALALQGWTVWMTYEPNVWALRPWAQGPGLALSSHKLADSPAVFVTVGSISHSLLVPLMHPHSRWSNVGGQQDLVPCMREFGQLQALLASPLPKYGVIRASKLVMTDDRQPTEAAWAVIRRAFKQQGLAPTSQPCAFLRVNLGGLPFELLSLQEHERGFWFCELERVATPEFNGEAQKAHAPEFDDVFAQVETRCPRYFPAGNAITRPSDDGVVRHYSRSDTSVSIHHSGTVYFKNMRALNPTVLGTVDEVRAGRFQLGCDRLPGRYLPPWDRGWGVDLE